MLGGCYASRRGRRGSKKLKPLSLDAKLAAAMTKLSHGELGRLFSLATERERLADPPRMIKGRHLLWMVHDYHKFDEEIGAIMDIKDLMSVKLRGDAGLETFMNSWDMVIAGMQELPVESILEPLFLEQVRAAPALRERSPTMTAPGKALRTGPMPTCSSRSDASLKGSAFSAIARLSRSS